MTQQIRKSQNSQPEKHVSEKKIGFPFFCSQKVAIWNLNQIYIVQIYISCHQKLYIKFNWESMRHKTTRENKRTIGELLETKGFNVDKNK